MKKIIFISALTILIIQIGACLGAGGSDGSTNLNIYKSELVSEAVNIVSMALKNPESQIRSNAIEVAAESKMTFLMPIVTEMLKDRSMPVRFAAAVAVGDMRYNLAKARVKSLLEDENENVVIAAAYAMIQLGDTQYAKTIAKRAMSQDQTLRANTAMLLGKIGDKGALEILYKIKDDEESSDAAAFSATEAIARLGDKEIYAKIWTMLLSVYPDDRYMGTIAMGTLGTPEAAGTLITMMEDDMPEVRLSAAGRLGACGDASGSAIVADYLDRLAKNETDKITKERRIVMAAIAIGQIGKTELVNYLPKMLKDDSVRVQLAAAKSVFLIEHKDKAKRP